MGPDSTTDTLAATFAVDGGSEVDFSSTVEIIPSNSLSAPATAVLGEQVTFTGSYTNSADGTNVIDHGIGPVGTPGTASGTFNSVTARVQFDYPTSPGSFDMTEQTGESVVYTLTSTNGAAPAVSRTTTATINVIDSEWPQWAMPDSATAYCVDPSTQAAVNCSSEPRQDGAEALNVPSYSQANSTAPVVDSVTGLGWTASSQGSGSWTTAISTCQALGAKWRLPTVLELQTLLDYGKSPPIPASPFVFTQIGQYWTSSVDAYNPYNNVAQSWTVSFEDGQVVALGQTQSHYILCVESP
jgi:hypothetical protein